MAGDRYGICRWRLAAGSSPLAKIMGRQFLRPPDEDCPICELPSAVELGGGRSPPFLLTFAVTLAGSPLSQTGSSPSASAAWIPVQ